MPPPQLRSRLELGSWRLIEKLGFGGNGEVWRAENTTDGRGVALKILTKVKDIAYKRFRTETETLQGFAGVPGIVPMLDSNLPADPREQWAWYAMPIGQPIVDALRNGSLKDAVRAVHAIAGAMLVMHQRGITHRDVKPANFIVIEGSAYLGDFGLVDFADKEDLTGKKEDIGPRWTMAPEVWRLGSKSDGTAADVYSLAKSLWILITKVYQGFDGAYAPESSTGIRRYLPEGEFVGPLDSILAEATEHDPRSRPSMTAFADKLKAWLDLDGLFHEQNRLEWAGLLTRLFPVTTPVRATWTAPGEIATVLSLLGERSNVNHMFYPTGGGMNLKTAYVSTHERGCIEMSVGGGSDLVRPKSLTFESFDGAIDCSYFRLELCSLKPAGVYKLSDDDRYEEVLRLGDTGRYVDRGHYDYGEFDGEPLPEGSEIVSRFFNGTFVIVGNASPFNQVGGPLDAYDARHDRITAEELRHYMQQLVDASRRVSRGKRR